MKPSNPLVDTYLSQAKKWQKELTLLREILLSCGLIEEIKWMKPCYSYQGTNLFIIGELKESCTLSFFNGVLLKDSKNILTKIGENTREWRRIKFTSAQEIEKLTPTLKSYILETIELEKKGIKPQKEATKEVVFVEELQNKLDTDHVFKKAFLALTPWRQKAYNIFFSGAKQSSTRTSRIQQYTKRILCWKGFHDCVCGHSKKMPNCDGSHKDFGGKSM